MDDNKKKLKCSFCGKDETQVPKLISGPNVYICSDCINTCNEILAGGFEDNSYSEQDMDNLPKPKEIKEFLDE